jgi:phage-related protein
MRTLTADAMLAKNKLADATPWVWLMKVELSPAETLYVARNNASVSYGGNTYVPFPFEISDAVEDGQGQPGQVTISVANVNREVTALLQKYRGLFGATVTLYLTYDGGLVVSDSFKVQSSSANDKAASFQIGNQDLFGVATPAGRFTRSRCQWRYLSAACGYVLGTASPAPPEDTQCDRTLWGANGCRAHQNQARFGGTPGIPRR